MEQQQSQTAQAIRNQAAELIEKGLVWLPGLSHQLASCEWAALSRQSGLSRLGYGTDRVRALDPRASRHVFTEIRSRWTAPDLPILVEHPFASEAYYRTLDLSFYAAGDLSGPDVERKVLAALDRLSSAPDMLAAVLDLVRVIHILRPPDPAYDVSHSDPSVPFSVFVSLPDEQNERGRLRLAEAILHESMHLQLTLLESHAPLVSRSEATLYSPWKRTVRPVQGVMHGLYVFGVIDAFLASLQGSPGQPAGEYISERRRQIAEEVSDVTLSGATDDLTGFGRLLHTAIVSRFG